MHDMCCLRVTTKPPGMILGIRTNSKNWRMDGTNHHVIGTHHSPSMVPWIAMIDFPGQFLFCLCL